MNENRAEKLDKDCGLSIVTGSSQVSIYVTIVGIAFRPVILLICLKMREMFPLEADFIKFS